MSQRDNSFAGLGERSENGFRCLVLVDFLSPGITRSLLSKTNTNTCCLKENVRNEKTKEGRKELVLEVSYKAILLSNFYFLADSSLQNQSCVPWTVIDALEAYFKIQ